MGHVARMEETWNGHRILGRKTERKRWILRSKCGRKNWGIILKRKLEKPNYFIWDCKLPSSTSVRRVCRRLIQPASKRCGCDDSYNVMWCSSWNYIFYYFILNACFLLQTYASWIHSLFSLLSCLYRTQLFGTEHPPFYGGTNFKINDQIKF
jgi:hypothetical protein